MTSAENAGATAKPKDAGATTVIRALSLLKLAATGTALRASVVAKSLNVDKSTGSRLIRTLASEGFLMRTGDGAEYTLGPAILELAATINRSADLPQLSFDVLTRLRDVTEETVSIQRRMDNVRVCVAQVPSQHSVRWVIEVGDARPLTAGSSAKVLLSALPDDEVRAIIKKARLERFTAQTLVGENLIADIQNTRTNGYALNEGERVDGVTGVAVPIRNSVGEIVAALAVSGPGSRWTKQRMMMHVSVLKEGARQISSRLRGTSVNSSKSTTRSSKKDR